MQIEGVGVLVLPRSRHHLWNVGFGLEAGMDGVGIFPGFWGKGDAEGGVCAGSTERNAAVLGDSFGAGSWQFQG